jgi:hypothetical protein
MFTTKVPSWCCHSEVMTAPITLLQGSPLRSVVCYHRGNQGIIRGRK